MVRLPQVGFCTGKGCPSSDLRALTTSFFAAPECQYFVTSQISRYVGYLGCDDTLGVMGTPRKAQLTATNATMHALANAITNGVQYLLALINHSIVSTTFPQDLGDCC